MDTDRTATSVRSERGVEPSVRPLMFALLLACITSSGAVHAANFPVSGTITVNGNGGALPSGGTFGNSSYDTTSGEISSGKFTFPQSSTTFHSDALGADVTVTYQLSQTNTSSGQVANDGVAALSSITLKLQAISAVIGVIPFTLGTCIFEPINIDLAGSGTASGLDLSDPAFTIPPVAPSDCGGLGSQVNGGIAGSDNSIQILLDGDFTPPQEDDTIFRNGFDPGT